MSFPPCSLRDCFPVPDAAGSARLEGVGMAKDFQYNVFLSHSSKDKTVVRELAARLQRDGARVWLDEEQIKPGDSIPAKIEESVLIRVHPRSSVVELLRPLLGLFHFTTATHG
jgi:hypothetical protein